MKICHPPLIPLIPFKLEKMPQDPPLSPPKRGIKKSPLGRGFMGG